MSDLAEQRYSIIGCKGRADFVFCAHTALDRISSY